MTALHSAMTTRYRFPTTVKTLERALTRAEYVRPATDSAPFFFTVPHGLSATTLQHEWIPPAIYFFSHCRKSTITAYRFGEEKA